MSTDAPVTRKPIAADIPLLLGVLTLFAVMVAGTWQRWTDPIIDHGRELNLPARLLTGERLYTDIQYLYGPLAPYLNAALYRCLGIHVNTLHASGALCAALVLMLCFVLARRVLDAWEAALAAALVLVLCVLRVMGNCIQPYSFGALYALVLALAALHFILAYLERPRARPLVAAAMATGFILTAKPEMALPVLVAAGATLALARPLSFRARLRALALYILPCLLVAGAIWGAILRQVPWRALLTDNYHFFIYAPPQLLYFNRFILGLTSDRNMVVAWLAALGAALVFLGLPAFAAAWITRADPREKKIALRRSGLTLLLGVGLWGGLALLADAERDAKPFVAAPVLLIGLILQSSLRGRRCDESEAPRARATLILALFALFALARLALRVPISSPYTPFALPMTVVLCTYIALRVAPGTLLPTEDLRRSARRIAIACLSLAVVVIGSTTVRRTRATHTFEISSERGRLLVSPRIGRPLMDAIRYVETHTRASEPIVVLPQGSLIHFLTARPNPLRQEIVHAGFLEDGNARDAIARIDRRGVRLLLIDNIRSPEFRDPVFGRDHSRALLAWIEQHFERRVVFSADALSGAVTRGDEEFFIAAYERLSP